MLKELYYVNNKNERIDFNTLPYLFQGGDLFDYEWDYKVINNTVKDFTTCTREFTIKLAVFEDNKEAFTRAVNQLYEVVEYDVGINTPGRLYVQGNQYMECFLIGSKKQDWQYGISAMLNTLTVVTDNPVWIKEELYSYATCSNVVSVDFPYDFPTEFYMDNSNKIVFGNDAVTDCAFKMEIYGPCSSPTIWLDKDKHCYSVLVTLLDKEVLTINAFRTNRSEYSIIRTKADGTKVNEFAYRRKDYSVFKKLPVGLHTLSPDSSFSMDLTIFRERRQPEWNLS